MKKSVLKKITAIMLFSIALGAVLLYSCKKNVGDVYNYAPTVLAPDFEISTVDYAFDNEALNSESELSFKVTYKNNEITGATYSSVLNFYVDGTIQKSIALENIAANTKYETEFDWRALAGKHDFKFEINLSSNGSKVAEEANTTNNSHTTSLSIAVKALVVAKTENVQATTVNQAIIADPVANVASVMAAEGIVISTTVTAVQTTYTDRTTAIVSAVTKSDGTTDPTKVVLSVTSNAGVTTGQAQQTTSTIIVETLIDQKQVSFYNANEKLTYTDGIVSFVKLKSAETFTPCTEPSNMQVFFADKEALKAFSDAISAAILQDGIDKGLASAPRILIDILAAFNLTQGNVDNPPTYTVEIINSTEICSTDCVNGVEVQTKSYPGFILSFSDDRNPGVVLSGTTNVISKYTKLPSCSTSNSGTYTFEDCGGNKVSYTFSGGRSVITTTNPCVGNVHN